MDRAFFRPQAVADSDRLLERISQLQFLQPHVPVGTALDRLAETMAICPRAVSHAINWLKLDPTRSIGRLRRTELTQLARSLHRFWLQNASQQANAGNV
jgi:hypothetical protein